MNRVSTTTAALLLAIFWAATFVAPDPRADLPPARFEPRLRRLFENNAPGIRALAVPMNGLLYLFGERRGSDAVFVATSRRQGRLLFLASERELEQGDAARLNTVIARNVDLVRARIEGLREGGATRVILLPVPTKLSVLLASDPSVRADVCGIQDAVRCDGGRTSAAYDHFAEATERGGAEVVSLQDLMAARAAHDLLFAYEDTHWTSLGLSLAAVELARVWLGQPFAPPVKIGRLPDAPGDLQHMLALPDRPFFRTHPAEQDLYDLEPSLHASCSSRAILLGTSYSRPRGQALAALLTRASGCPVLDLSVDGEGPVASFHALFAEHAQDLRGAVVLWELPFRDVADPRAFLGH
jgi:hypothetical protein